MSLKTFRAVVVALTLASPALAQAPLTPHQRLAREVYAELVSINSADSVGSVTKAAEAMAKRFRDAGFPAGDVQVLIPPGKPTKGNLVVRYRGRGGANAAKPILLLAHIDVVAARREEWPRDPFTMVEENGYFLGRGTADDKAMAAIFVANVLRYKQQNWRPDRDLILALTADEEGGDANGVEYLLKDHRSLIDAVYAINEGGGGTLNGMGPDARPFFHSIQAAEKVYTDFTLTANNPGGHSSVPRPDNAIYELADALGRLEKYDFPVQLNETTRGFFEKMAAVEHGQLAQDMKSLTSAKPDPAAIARLAAQPPYNAQMRTTCVATRLEGGHAENALPQLARATVNCRILPGQPVEDIQKQLEKVFADPKLTITAVMHSVGSEPSALNKELVSAIEKLTEKFWPGIPTVPTMVAGATDGRFLRNAGIPTYGHSGLASDIFDVRAHGKDERVEIKVMFEGEQYLFELVKLLSGG